MVSMEILESKTTPKIWDRGSPSGCLVLSLSRRCWLARVDLFTSVSSLARRLFIRCEYGNVYVIRTSENSVASFAKNKMFTILIGIVN